jgi:hypothetical protein
VIIRPKNEEIKVIYTDEKPKLKIIYEKQVTWKPIVNYDDFPKRSISPLFDRSPVRILQQPPG